MVQLGSGKEGQFRRQIQGEANNTKDLSKNPGLIYSCRVSKYIYVRAVLVPFIKGNSDPMKYSKLTDKNISAHKSLSP